MKYSIPPYLALLCLIAIYPARVLAQKSFPDDFRKKDIGQDFQWTSLYSLEGELVDMQQYQDKILVMNYWFVGCRGCMQEEAFLKQVSEHFADTEEVVFLSVSPSSKEQIQDWFDQKGSFGYPVLLGKNFKFIKQQFGVKTYPRHQIIVRGRIEESLQVPIFNQSATDWFIERITDLQEKD
ncbi:MAG: TlpA disulfide reductase family protein [Bacteroidota bacterium]